MIYITKIISAVFVVFLINYRFYLDKIDTMNKEYTIYLDEKVNDKKLEGR